MIFYCDGMLGKLAKHLRMFGLNCIFVKNHSTLTYQDKYNDQSFFLTRKAEGIKHPHVIIIKSDSVKEQLEEIKHLIKPFVDAEKIMNRCIVCNTKLVNIEKSNVEHLVPEYIFHKHELFWICQTCNKIYWAGSHTEHMQKWIKKLFSEYNH